MQPELCHWVLGLECLKDEGPDKYPVSRLLVIVWKKSSPHLASPFLDNPIPDLTTERGSLSHSSCIRRKLTVYKTSLKSVCLYVLGVLHGTD